MNPTIGCKLPPKKSGEMKVLSAAEVRRFLIQAQVEGMLPLYLLELSSGLRRGEIIALQWKDLNFETGELRIDKQVYRVDGELMVIKPKTYVLSIEVTPRPDEDENIVLANTKRVIRRAWALLEDE